LSAFIHPQGLCETSDVGDGTRVWAFAHVLAGARIGRDCNICDHVFIEEDVIVGDRVTVKCGVQLWNGLRVGDDVFIGPNATFCNDAFPRSKVRPPRFAETVIESGASIGANATVLPGLVIGRNAMVGAGAVVTRPVPANAIVVGNPAHIVGYVDAERIGVAPTASTVAPPTEPGSQAIGVGAVRLHRLPRVADMRGSLSVGEFGRTVPFEARRYFVVFDVPSREVRGEHAHRESHQFLVCVRGSIAAIVDDGTHRAELLLDQPELALHIPPMIWGTQYRYTDDAVLLVFSSHYYDSDEYIRDYDVYLDALRGKGR